MEQVVMPKDPTKGGRAATKVAGRTEAERNAMVSGNMGLAGHIVRRYVLSCKRVGRNVRAEFADDMMQEAALGLMRAAEKFDPDMGIKFATYAGHWIHQRLQRLVCEDIRGVHIPWFAVREMRQFRAAENDMASDEGHKPDADAVAESFDGGSTRRKRIAMMGRFMEIKWEPIDKVEYQDHPPVYDPPIDEPDPAATALRVAVGRLSPKQAKAVALRFGLDGNGERSFKQIGAELGFTREYGRQLVKAGVEALRLRPELSREAA